MQCRTLSIITLASMVLLGGTIHAEQLQFASAHRMTAVESKLVELEAQLAAYQSGAYETANTDIYAPCCAPTSCLSLTAELLFLRPFQSDSGMGTTSYYMAPRLTAGWTSPGGIGLRARWFEYDISAFSGFLVPDQFRLSYFDLELTDTFQLGCKWNGILSGGVRFAEYIELEPLNDVDFDGTGLLLGVELMRPVTSNIALFFNGRESLVFGKDHANAAAPLDDLYVLLAITEMQLGIEWRRECLRGEAFVRGAAEAQHWSGISDDDTEDFGVIGGTLMVGFNR